MFSLFTNLVVAEANYCKPKWRKMQVFWAFLTDIVFFGILHTIKFKKRKASKNE